MRLTLIFAAVIVGSSVVVAGLVYVFMAKVPTYEFSTDAFQAVDPAAVASSTSSDAPDTTGALSISEEGRLLSTLLLASTGAVIILAIGGGVVGWVIAGRVVEPIAVIDEATTRAAHGDLTARADVGSAPSEIHDLARNFDAMLDALQASLDAHHRFTSNASHELRSPLATTQTMIDVALADNAATADDLRELARRVRIVNSRNLETVDALLDLAELQQHRRTHDPVDLAMLVREVTASAAEGASSRRIAIHEQLVEPAIVDGEAPLLRQALENLLANAIRHNVDGGRIEITVTAADDRTTLTVANTGPMIDPATIASLREPFVRTDGRAAWPWAGRGLGLPIVDAIATAHEADLTLKPGLDGGLTVHLSFPAPSARGRWADHDVGDA